MIRLIALLLLASSACAAEQPDLNMDDLRKFSRRFCIKTDRCRQPLHPNIEDRRTSDTSMEVPYVADMRRLPSYNPEPSRVLGVFLPEAFRAPKEQIKGPTIMLDETLTPLTDH